jgi:acetate kinase
VRARIAAGFAWLGVSLDGDANDANATRISTFDSAVEVFVIPADEERIIACHTRQLCRGLFFSAA